MYRRRINLATNLRARLSYMCAHINSHNAFLAGRGRGGGRARARVLITRIVFHERNRRSAIHAFRGPARQSTARRERWDDLKPITRMYFSYKSYGPARHGMARHSPARPARYRVAILPINFHSVEHLPGYIRGLGRKGKSDHGEGSVFHSALHPECRLL